MQTIGVLNLQGAVDEHLSMLAKIDSVNPVSVKHPEDITYLDGLIIPGGESTTISQLMRENELVDAIKQFAQAKKGILGTCAGLVLCGKTTTQVNDTDDKVASLGLIDITVARNGFGRQIDSFEVSIDIDKIGNQIPSVFIRAPYIASYSERVTPLAFVDNHCIIAESGNVLVCSFHPELTNDTRVIQYFITQHCSSK